MTTNFIQVNPGAANQENDATFASDSLTTGGVGTDAILPSPWLNKVWFQSSTFIAALATSMSNKGFTLSDANISTLTGVLANLLTYADPVVGPLSSPSFSSTIAFDASASNTLDVTLSGNVTAFSIANTRTGQVVTISFTQDATGGRTVATPTATGGISGWVAPNTAANAVTTQSFIKKNSGALVPFAAQPGLGTTQNLSTNGWVRLSNGLTLQWCAGTSQSDSSVTQTVNYPISFSSVLRVFPSALASSFNDTEMPTFVLISQGTSSCVVGMQRVPDHGFVAATPLIFAIGIS